MRKLQAVGRCQRTSYPLYCLILAVLVIGMSASTLGQNPSFPPATGYLNLQMGSVPSLAVFNNKLYVAFRANDSSNILYISSSSDGVNFPAATGYSNISMGSAPSLAVFNNRLYVAFRANDSRNILFITSSADGVNFSAATGYSNITMGGAPSLAAYNNNLFVAFRSNDSSNTLVTTSSSDGVTFPAGTPSSAIAMGSDPALAAFNNQLQVAFRANDSSNQLFVSSSSTGTNFPAATGYPGIQMGTGPAMTALNGALYVSSQSNDSTHALLVAAGSAASSSSTVCATAWSSTAIYTGGALVSYGGENYKAAYWTQGNNPSTSSGAQGSGQPWIPEGSCSASGGSTTSVTFPSSATAYPSILIGGAPTMTTFNGALYVGFKSNDSRNILFLTNSAGGNTLATTGTVTFHVLLGVSTAGEQLQLAGDNYTDLIMSNMIAGVMYGHLVNEGFPGIQYNKDYLYGSVMAQLLQENIATEDYQSSSNLIDPAAGQQAVMGAGQGGPYQINNYPLDMVSGTTPAGHSLVNFIAIQKNLGYTIAGSANQQSQPTPASFNNKYYGPMLPAYFHFVDMLSLQAIGKAGGTPPWEPYYDESLTSFKNLPNSFLDMILNAAYNQGYWGGLVASYSQQGASATESTVTTVDSYSSIWGAGSTYQQYPYQVHYYLDQMFDNPTPTTSPTTLITPTNHIVFNMAALENVFSNVFQTLDYSNGTNPAQFFTAGQAQTAFNSALSQQNVVSTASLDLSNASDRAKIFAVIDSAIGNLEATVGMKFNAETNSQL